MNSKRGRREEEGSEEVPITCHGHKTLPSHAVKIVRQLLTFVKKFGLEHPKLKQSGEQEEPLFIPDRKGKSPTVNTPEALPAILGGGARAFRSIPIAACSDWD